MNITRYFQFKTAAINSAFAITSTVNLHNTDRRGTMQQCPVPADNMGIAFHQPLTLSLTAKGCFLGMLQLRLMAPTNLTASTQEECQRQMLHILPTAHRDQSPGWQEACFMHRTWVERRVGWDKSV